MQLSLHKESRTKKEQERERNERKEKKISENHSAAERVFLQRNVASRSLSLSLSADRLQEKEGRLLSLARNLADRETGSHQQGRQQRTPIVVVVASTVFSLNFCTGLSGYSRKVINARKESGNHVAVQIKR